MTMRRLCGLVCALVVVYSSAVPAADDKADSWVGQKVQVNKWNVKLGEGTKKIDTRIELGDIFHVTKVSGDWLFIGRSWINKNDVVRYDEAIDYFKARIAANPADGHHDLAECYYKRGDIDQAIVEETEALRLQPDNRRYHNNRGVFYNSKGQWDLAIADFDEVIRLNPNHALAFSNRGIAHRELRHYDQMLADFNESIRLDGKLVLPYDGRGQTWARLGQYDKALAAYEEAIKIDPKFDRPYRDRAWLWATCPDANFRDGAKAVESATRACDLTNWKSSVNLDTVAAAYAEQGDFAAAAKWETEALKFKLPPGTGSLTPAAQQARLQLYQAGQPYRDVRK